MTACALPTGIGEFLVGSRCADCGWCDGLHHPKCPCRPVEQHLPVTAQERKAIPIATGVIDYFPDALMEVAKLSKIGNDQHNPGQPLHWSRGKSDDHPDCLMRHFLDRGTVDTDGARHSAKVVWRALAILQLEIENDKLSSSTAQSVP